MVRRIDGVFSASEGDPTQSAILGKECDTLRLLRRSNHWNTTVCSLHSPLFSACSFLNSVKRVWIRFEKVSFGRNSTKFCCSYSVRKISRRDFGHARSIEFTPFRFAVAHGNPAKIPPHSTRIRSELTRSVFRTQCTRSAFQR